LVENRIFIPVAECYAPST